MKGFTAAFLALIALPGAAEASGLSAAFDIVRKGNVIGYHAVEVNSEGGEITTRTRIHMRVRFGPITAFRYDLASTERWKDGALQAIDSKTARNGKEMALTVRRAGEAFLVDGSSFKGFAPLDAIPGSYWNKNIVTAPVLLNTQNGSLVPVKATELGFSKTPAGETAEHYRLSGTVDLDLWYKGEKWAGAEFTIKGEDLAYREMSAADQAALFSELGFAGS